MAIFRSDKVDFRAWEITKERDKYYIIVKVLI